ncbi:MAG: cyclic pyranopterin monophosphate synthase MoaC [Myxococcales bacterium]|nr:cyclic pyranopterin monophosphate synthase MoaC [Myxococcales bacterium]
MAQVERTKLSHLDERGAARMVDVGGKPETARRAVAAGRLLCASSTLHLIQQGELAKGDVLQVARLAGLQAAKRTAELIPLCHPVRLTAIRLELSPDPNEGALDIRAEVEAVDRTGVEMEALTAVTVAALTVYDMCKAVDRGMRIAEVRLLEKHGGRSGSWHAPGQATEPCRALHAADTTTSRLCGTAPDDGHEHR